MNETKEAVFLVKLGELVLKGGNREGFEQILRRNLLTMIRSRLPGARVVSRPGRFYVMCAGEQVAVLEPLLGKLSGITGWARSRSVEKNVDSLLAACVDEGKRLAAAGVCSFKVTARRSDKSFPLDSYQICCAAGDAISAAVPALAVNVGSPGGVISVEIREKAYVYSLGKKGLRGLPVGSAGRGLLLLSGGIDSPVAGILMAVRGMGLDAVYFHTPPYTSEQALAKTLSLAETIGSYALGVRLYTVNFTEVQKRIKERAPEKWSTVLLRMAMMDAASSIAKKNRAKCLVTGESLSQVASQTVENLGCGESRAGLPVLRPLIGMDKEAIIVLAKKFGSYETSILPYADCCVLFSPAHPVLRGSIREAGELYAGLETEPLIAAALGSMEIHKRGYYEPRKKPYSSGAK
ncbi:MAG: tRNA 4-thiouridine(8) synthase ThiI [Treponema sp.]|nr:tRNA 4-thiouridine(8) synthase ThiI [Treponema sp.]